MKPTLTHRGARVLAWLERESLPVTVFGLFACGLIVRLPDQLRQDGWLALVSGRLVADSGLPTTDTLTAWTAHVQWVDQQWLGQLFLYRLASAGNLRLVMLVHVGLLAGAMAAALIAARWRGGSARSVGLVAAPALVVILMSAQMRVQSIAYPLFVAVAWLLIADVRASSRRVLLVLPILVLWANVHGSVVLGALLTTVAGLLLVARALRNRAGAGKEALLRGALLVVGPCVCIFASPYGSSLFHYYGSTAFNSSFGRIVSEWQHSWPSLVTLPFYVLAALSAWLLLRDRRAVSVFEQIALLLLFLAGVSALRNMVWFSFFALIVVPLPLGKRLGEVRGKESRTVKTVLAATAIAAVSVAGAAAASRPDSWLTSSVYPIAAADAVASAAAKDPTAHIYSDVRFADWLLWTRPELAGRIAYDARFELLSSRELEQLYRLQNRLTPGWLAPVAGHGLVVLPRVQGAATARALLAHGARSIYRDRSVVILLRSR
ncbi:MAG TPA: hypothetical protein VK613_14140 [Gaiellaceae bacterium]|nr:hypothetical protein [Gaiellaceae bacterium]